MVSENGIALVESSEGLSLSVYKDANGNPTVGYGHKLEGDEEYLNGITQEEAESLLKADLEIADEVVSRLAPQANQNQHDALCDFCFNLGRGSLVMLLSHGFAQIPAQLPRWVYAGGVVQPGLVKRREAEVELFNKEV
jgi:lysozyme